MCCLIEKSFLWGWRSDFRPTEGEGLLSHCALRQTGKTSSSLGVFWLCDDPTNAPWMMHASLTLEIPWFCENKPKGWKVNAFHVLSLNTVARREKEHGADEYKCFGHKVFVQHTNIFGTHILLHPLDWHRPRSKGFWDICETSWLHTQTSHPKPKAHWATNVFADSAAKKKRKDATQRSTSGHPQQRCPCPQVYTCISDYVKYAREENTHCRCLPNSCYDKSAHFLQCSEIWTSFRSTNTYKTSKFVFTQNISFEVFTERLVKPV